MPENPHSLHRVCEKETALPIDEVKVATRDYRGGIQNGMIIGTMGGFLLGLGIGIGSPTQEEKIFYDDLRNTCNEAAPTLDKATEELPQSMRAMRELCEKHGFIKIHQPNE